MINFLDFIPVLAVFAIVAVVKTGAECSSDRIRACASHMQNLPTGVNPDCSLVTRAVDCFKREVAECPEMGGLIETSLKALENIDQMCRTGEAGGGDNSDAFGDLETCDTTKMENCVSTVKNARTEEEKCRAIGTVRKCVRDFKSTCKSDMVNNMLDSQMEGLSAVEDKCNSGRMVQPASLILAALVVAILTFFRYFL